MIKFFRNIRRRLLGENRFTRYLIYAIGEIILVVIGILIALQINNANQRRIENETLWGYMRNIESNIENDLVRLTDINFVLDQLSTNTPNIWELRRKSDFTFRDYRLVQDHMNTVFSGVSFKTNTFGFETLQSTGYMGKLQGTDMEILLFNYYELAEQLTNWTNSERAFLDDILMEVQKTDWEISGETFYRLENDSTLFADVRIKYVKMLNSRLYDAAILSRVFNPLSAITSELNFLGNTIISLIDKNTLEASSEIMRSVELYNRDFSGIGLEEVVINGIIPRAVALYTNSDKGFEQVKFEGNEDYVKINMKPGLDWGAAMFVVDSLGRNVRAAKDFSAFESIEVELKGSTGNEIILLALKDKSDPDDGTEAYVTIDLTKDWKTYRYNLRENFPTADLKNLHQLAGFVARFTEDMEFYIKNVRFLKAKN